MSWRSNISRISKDEALRTGAPTEVETMQGSLAFKMIRGLVFRAGWVLLYVLHLALVAVALSMFFDVALVAFDAGGGVFDPGQRHLAVGKRCAMCLLYGSLGLLSVVGALKLKQYHRRINPLYPEMQIGFHLARAMTRERPTPVRPPRSADPLYDRDLDGGL
jgi:hypothetical protein